MSFLPDDKGPRLVEVVLLVVLVAIIMIAMVAILEPVIGDLLGWIAGTA